jgi:hypothetical protein
MRLARWPEILLLAGGIGLAPAPAGAQVVESLGTRALGMGGAFVAVADDATAVYWNPAGLATGAFFSVALEWQDLGGGAVEGGPGLERDVGGTSTFFGLTTLPVGLVYYRQRAEPFAWQTLPPPPEAGAAGVAPGPGASLATLVTRHFGFAVAQTLTQGVVVGSVLKLVRGSAGEQGVAPWGATGEIETRASNRFDADVGLMVDARRVRVGLVARNLTAPAFETPGGTRLALDRQVRAGVAWLPSDRVTVAVDADLTRTPTVVGDRRQLAAGAEAWWGRRRVGTRAGMRLSTTGEGEAVGTVGLSAGLTGWLWLDGHLARGGTALDRAWGVALRAGF